MGQSKQNDTDQQGTLFILSAASGTGKSSLSHALAQRDDGIVLSVSHTTRAQLSGEIAGRDYYYVTEDMFREMVQQHQFLEYAKVFDHYYGTSKVAVEEMLLAGKDVLLEIDWQGAQTVRAAMSHAVSIFLLPPSMKALEARLLKRGRDSRQVIAQRLAGASQEIAHCVEFDYLVVNQDFDLALSDLRAIITSFRLKKARQAFKYQQLLEDLIEK